VSEFSLRTAGPAKRIELFPDTRSLTTDGKDISHVEFRVVDTDGTRVPNAENKVTFSVEGPGKILCTENADLNSTEDYRSNTHSVFHGRGLLILQSTLEKGAIKLKAESPDLETATIEWNSH
jgi:beta-galactosidase